MKLSPVIGLRKLEPFLLIIISFIGWALGDTNRMTFSGLEDSDYWDLLATSLLVFTGFYIWKVGLRSGYFFFRPFVKYLVFVLLTYIVAIMILVCEEMLVYGDVSVTGIMVYTTPLFVVYSLIFISYLLILEKSSDAAIEDPFSQVIEVETFNGMRLIEYHKIVCFQSVNKLSYVLEENREKYKVTQTLKELEDILPKNLFFRANRQFIVSRAHVTGYSSSTFQKIQVTWKDEPGEHLPAIIISKYTAPEFKKWLNS